MPLSRGAFSCLEGSDAGPDSVGHLAFGVEAGCPEYVQIEDALAPCCGTKGCSLHAQGLAGP